MKTLAIKPDGHLIKGGTFAYDIKDDGTVSLKIHIDAHLGIDHPIDNSETYKVDPKIVHSKTVAVDQALNIGKFHLIVRSVKDRVAQADINIDGIGNGVAQLDLTQDLISFKYIKAQGHYLFSSVTLETA